VLPARLADLGTKFKLLEGATICASMNLDFFM